MWNNPQASAYEGEGQEDPAQSDSNQNNLTPADNADDPYAEITWTAEQLQRMESEWRRLQRAFAYHPHVTLSPLRGDPPNAYQVDYRLTTITVNSRTNQLEYVANATLHITLPPGFPDQPPAVKPITSIFHPNISYEGLYIEELWHRNETLLGLIRKVGEVLAYRSYDPDYAVNPAAMDWLAANHALLPIDQQANLTPTAGGEPLARICKYGPQSLDSMKQSILATQSALFGSSAPDPATVRDYAHKTTLALNLFLEKDVPDNLQSLASELEEAARELVSMFPMYDFVRERRRQVSNVRVAVKQLLLSKDPLAAEVDRMVALVDAGDPEEPMVALKLIPDRAKLQPLQFALPKHISEAEKRVSSIRAGLDALAGLHQPALIPPESLLGHRLERELRNGSADVEMARKEAASALALFHPVLDRAVSENIALDVAARWREYLDMGSKARWMERKIREWGAEGLQGFYIENAGGTFGPFQFEQSVDVGTGDLIGRSLGGKSIEVRDPVQDVALGQSTTGTLVIELPAPPDPETPQEYGSAPSTFPTRFTMTERCDDLIVLLEFLRRSTIETVQRFATYNGTAQSWAGKVCRVLSRPEVKKGLEEELARAARRWRHTIVDLAALSPWKERLATYFLLHRCTQTIPHLVAAITDCKQKNAASKKKVNDIMTKCGRDVETGTLIVPPKYSKPYDAELKLQDQCIATVTSSTTLLKSLVQQLTLRLQSGKLLGKGTVSELRAVPALPETLAGLPLDDGLLGNMIAPLEEMLQTSLGGPAPESAAEETSAEDAGAYDSDAVQDESPMLGDEAAYAEDEGVAAIEDDGMTAVGPTHENTVVQPAGEEGVGAAGEIAVVEEAVHADSDWIVQEEESEEFSAGDYEQTDVVFGFEPEPSPPPVPGKGK